MRNYTHFVIILCLIFGFFVVASPLFALPTTTVLPTILPSPATSTIGTLARQWANGFFDNLNIASGTIPNLSAGMDSKIGNENRYWKFEELDLGVFGQYPVLSPYSDGLVGNVGLIANSLGVYDRDSVGYTAIVLYPSGFGSSVALTSYGSYLTLNTGLQPTQDASFDLGTSDYRWNNLFLTEPLDASSGGTGVGSFTVGSVPYYGYNDAIVNYSLMDSPISTDGININVTDRLVFSSTSFNTLVGVDAGKYLASGANYNTFLGYNTGMSNATNTSSGADYNTAVGWRVLSANTSGNRNTAVGIALNSNTSGINNTAIGANTLTLSTNASYNVSVGQSALLNKTSGDKNTAIGTDSLHNNLTGGSNVALGYYAGGHETGSNTFYVDNQNRTNTAGDKAGALLYGTFDSTPSAQTLKINASTTVSGNLLSTGDFRADDVILTGDITAEELYLSGDIEAVNLDLTGNFSAVNSSTSATSTVGGNFFLSNSDKALLARSYDDPNICVRMRFYKAPTIALTTTTCPF